MSTGYGTIGKGITPAPRHSFVLSDKAGVQGWYGEYPSMWLSTGHQLKEVLAHLAD